MTSCANLTRSSSMPTAMTSPFLTALVHREKCSLRPSRNSGWKTLLTESGDARRAMVTDEAVGSGAGRMGEIRGAGRRCRDGADEVERASGPRRLKRREGGR